MKKLICTLLGLSIVIAAVVFMSAETQTCGSDPAAPVYVEGYTYGNFDELRIRKIYQLSSIQEAGNISVEDFESGGQTYHYIGAERISGAELEPYIREKIDHSENIVFCAAVFGKKD